MDSRFNFQNTGIALKTKRTAATLATSKVSTAANRSESFCSQTILPPLFLQFKGLAYGKN